MVFLDEVLYIFHQSPWLSMFIVGHTSERTVTDRFKVSVTSLRRVMLVELFVVVASTEYFVVVVRFRIVVLYHVLINHLLRLDYNICHFLLNL